MPVLKGRTKSVVRVARLLLFPAVVAGVFLGALPHIADLEDVWHLILRMTAGQAAILAGLTALNVVTYWPVLVAGLPGLGYRKAALVNQSSTSVAMTIPGGGALAVGVSYAMYTSWGFSRSDVGLVTVSTGIANFAVKLALPLAAVALVAMEGDPAGDLLSGAIVGIAVLAAGAGLVLLILRDERVARWAGTGIERLVRRSTEPAWGDAAGRFRGRLVELLKRRWAFLTSATVVSQLSVYLVLLASLRFVGIPDSEIGWAQALAVFALVRLASAVPIVPGNVGLAELGYIGGLLLAGGDRTHVVAAVLVFRVLTYFLQIPLGGITYVLWRRGLRRRLGGDGSGGAAEGPQDPQDGPEDHRDAPGDGGADQAELRPADHGAPRHDQQPSVTAT
jgi:putative heme transporter